MEQFQSQKVQMGSIKDILPHHDDSLISQFNDRFAEEEKPVQKATKQEQRVISEQTLKVEIKLKNIETKEVQTAAANGATVSQKASDVKQNNTRLEAIYGGINEDLFIEAKKKDRLYQIKEVETGSLANVKTDEEEDDEDPHQQKYNFEFLSDILALLYRLGIIKQRMEKKDGKNGKR
jgi:hypothetical protein